jgi:hypothetical protein
MVLTASGRENVVAAAMKDGGGKDSAPALRVKRLSEHAVLPKRGSSGAAGYDLARWVPN